MVEDQVSDERVFGVVIARATELNAEKHEKRIIDVGHRETFITLSVLHDLSQSNCASVMESEVIGLVRTIPDSSRDIVRTLHVGCSED